MTLHTLNHVRFTNEFRQELTATVPSFVLSDPNAHRVAFGFDHDLGYFIQVITMEEVEYEDEDGRCWTEMEEVIIFDLDSKSSGLRGWQLGYLIDKIYSTTGCEITMTTRQLALAIKRAYNDLPM